MACPCQRVSLPHIATIRETFLWTISIYKPQAKVKTQSNPRRERGIWPLGCHYNLNDPLLLLSTQKTGGQQEEEHGVVDHVQGEHYQRNVLRVWVKVIGPVGNPESTLQIPGLVPADYESGFINTINSLRITIKYDYSIRMKQACIKYNLWINLSDLFINK